MEDLTQTYRQFLEELKKAAVKDIYKKDVTSLLDNLGIPVYCKERFNSFVTFFDSIVDKTKHGLSNWEGLCKAMLKKGSSKASRLFVLNTPPSDIVINVGLVALVQSESNSKQLRNFVFMIYCSVCKLLFEDLSYQASGATKTNYTTICKIFENEESTPEDPSLDDLLENPSELVKLYVGMLDKLCESGLDGKKLCQMVLDNNNPIVAAVLGSSLGNMVDIPTIRSQVEKLDNDDIVSILKTIKDRLSDIDLTSLVKNLRNMNPEELTKTVSELQSTFLQRT